MLPSDGDVFFDLEGDIFAVDGGLEYLAGVVEPQRLGFHIYHYSAWVGRPSR